MLNLVIFGAPGSGKGTQSARLIDMYGLHHISTGEVLRAEIARGTELGKLADSYISKGNLIPDDLMIRILDEMLPKLVADGKGVVFDGFPRTIAQAGALEKLLAKHGTELQGVIGLEVPEAELVDRMLKRGAQTGRADDNEDTIKHRLSVYHTQTQPLRTYYVEKGKYMSVDGSGVVDEIFSRIAARIEKHTGVRPRK